MSQSLVVGARKNTPNPVNITIESVAPEPVASILKARKKASNLASQGVSQGSALASDAKASVKRGVDSAIERIAGCDVDPKDGSVMFLTPFSLLIVVLLMAVAMGLAGNDDTRNTKLGYQVNGILTIISAVSLILVLVKRMIDNNKTQAKSSSSDPRKKKQGRCLAAQQRSELPTFILLVLSTLGLMIGGIVNLFRAS